MDKRCGSCRWWGEKNEDGPRAFSYFAGLRTCRAVIHDVAVPRLLDDDGNEVDGGESAAYVARDGTPKATVCDGSGYFAALRTLDDFGCLAFREARPAYFTPSSFWRLDGGAEWRGWLAMPRFYGDRERWVSGGYTFGDDDREVRYHTARAGLSYELAGGVGVVIDGQLTRSAVYNAGRLSIGLRLKQVAVPGP